MAKKLTVNYIKLGILVTSGLLLLVVSLYFIGSKKNLFGNTFRLYAIFQDVSGLKSGNNVRYAGIDIGTVEEITIINDTVIRTELLLEERMLKVIRKNAMASIGTDGLMGDKLVNIDAGSQDAEFVSEGYEISSLRNVNTDEMLRTLEFTNRNVAVVSANLKSLTETINESKGTLYTILMDTTLSLGIHKALDNIESASKSLNSFAGNLSDAGHGLKSDNSLMGSLLTDTSLAGDFRITISRIRESGEQLSAATKNMQEVLEKVNHGSGTLNTLVNDSNMSVSLKNAIQNIDSSSVKLNENLEALKHSWLLRGYFRKQEKKKND